jgi:hypothetical protein
MSERPDGFLARWSRRKIEVQREEARTPAPLPEDADAPAPEPRPEAEELSPEEIAALPKIEELTLESDISVFLRKGVPEVLKNAALRRVWSLDPAIRDYVGDARDYAYDWNVPGGVPGNGSLLPSDDVEAMLRGMFSKSPTGDVAAAAGDKQSSESQSREAASLPVESAPIDERTARPAGSSPAEPLAVAPDAPNALVGRAEIPPEVSPERLETSLVSEPETAPIAPRRRHGGAKPV